MLESMLSKKGLNTLIKFIKKRTQKKKDPRFPKQNSKKEKERDDRMSFPPTKYPWTSPQTNPRVRYLIHAPTHLRTAP